MRVTNTVLISSHLVFLYKNLKINDDVVTISTIQSSGSLSRFILDGAYKFSNTLNGNDLIIENNNVIAKLNGDGSLVINFLSISEIMVCLERQNMFISGWRWRWRQTWTWRGRRRGVKFTHF